MNDTERNIDLERLPSHIAVIMDGNGRWAQQRGLPRQEGHVEGVNAVRRITEEASRLGIRYLTLYAFSTENWNRPKEEVDALMHLIALAIERETPDLISNNVRLNLIGDLDRLPEDARRRLFNCVAQTSSGTGLTLTLALSYSSRWELTEAARRIARDVAQGVIDISDITPECVASRLDTFDMPDPDLLIRTGGNCRVSNFLLWQIAYSEIYITELFWPEFDANALHQAIIDYQGRERRFGLTSEQITHNP